MGVRQTKTCQQSVANQSSDVTPVTANVLVADIAVGSDNCEEFFGIDAFTKGCRADDVDKCHGKLPALGGQSLAPDARRRPRPPNSSPLIRIRLAVHDDPMFSAIPAARTNRPHGESG